MVSTTFIKDMKMELKRPSARSSEPSSTKSLRVYIDRLHNVYFNNQKIQSWTLQGKIKDQLKDKKFSSLLIVTDEKVQVDRVIEIVDQARLAGMTDIGISTKGE